MIRIAPPAAIVLASMTTTETETRTHRSQENIRNRSTNFILGGKTRTMEDIAHETIQEIANSQCCSLVIHVFSNGGAFLWEAMRRILYPELAPSSSSFLTNNQRRAIRDTEGMNHSIKFDSSDYPNPTDTTESSSATTEAVRNKLIGTVFDSSPAEYSMQPDLINHALQHCPFGERVRIRSYLILQAATQTLMGGNDAGRVSATTRRASEFWTGMRNFAAVSQELYIYSGVDSLTPPDPLRELIEARKRSFGEDWVQCREFDSAHCCHGVTYPEEYARVVKDFLDCLGRGQSSSGLRIDGNQCREEKEGASNRNIGNENSIRSRL